MLHYVVRGSLETCVLWLTSFVPFFCRDGVTSLSVALQPLFFHSAPPLLATRNAIPVHTTCFPLHSVYTSLRFHFTNLPLLSSPLLSSPLLYGISHHHLVLIPNRDDSTHPFQVNPERWYYHADKTGVVVFQDMVQKYGGASDASEWPPYYDYKMHYYLIPSHITSVNISHLILSHTQALV